MFDFIKKSVEIVGMVYEVVNFFSKLSKICQFILWCVSTLVFIISHFRELVGIIKVLCTKWSDNELWLSSAYVIYWKRYISKKD